MDDIIAWIVIGAAASLAAMVLPGRRGSGGVVASLASGVLGAAVFGLVARWLLPGSMHERSVWSLPCAAFGALAVSLLLRPRVAHHVLPPPPS